MLGSSPDGYERQWNEASVVTIIEHVPFKFSRRLWIRKLVLSEDTERGFAMTNTNIIVFNTKSGKTISTLVCVDDTVLTCMLIHSSTQSIVCGCTNGLLVMLADTGQTKSKLAILVGHLDAVSGLELHPSSNLVLSASLDGTVRLWDVELLREVFVYKWKGPVWRLWNTPLAFVADTTEGIMVFEIQLAARRMEDIRTPILMLQMFKQKSHSSMLVMCKDSLHVFTGDHHGIPSCTLDDFDPGEVVAYGHDPAAQLLYYMDIYKRIRVANTANVHIQPLFQADFPGLNVECVLHLERPEDGRTLGSVLHGHSVHESIRYKLSKWRDASSVRVEETTECQMWMVVGTTEGKFVFLDLCLQESSRMIATTCSPIIVPAHDAPVVHIVNNASSHQLLSIDSDGVLKLWTMKPYFKHRDTIHLLDNRYSCIQMAQFGHSLLIGYESGEIEIVDFRTAKVREKKSISCHIL